MTDAQFKNFLSKNGIEILRKDIDDFVIVSTKYGICRVRRYNLRNGVIPTIQSAVNKNEYFMNTSIEIYGNLYDYSKVEYTKAIERVTLICKIHGEFKVTPNAHLDKKKHQGCPKCTKDIPSKRLIGLEKFKERASIKHNHFYNYSLINTYTGQYNVLKIICPLHGEFTQTAKDHLRGHGCRECANNKIAKSRGDVPTGWGYSNWIEAAKRSRRFDSYKVYVIRCYDEQESFIKIGRTYQKISKRFRTKEMLPYKFEILHEIIDSGINVCKLESELKLSCKDYKYKPIKKFNGSWECYTEECLTLLSTIPK